MKFVVYFLSPFIAVLLILIRIPWIEDQLKSIHPWFPNLITVILVLGTAYNYYLTVFSPYKILEKRAKENWALLEKSALKLTNKYRKYDLSFNIMIPNRKFLYAIEPSKRNSKKKKFRFSGKVFKVIWKSANSHYPGKLNLTVNQGVCGDVYQNGTATNPQNVKGVVSEEIMNYQLNFTEEQNELTKGLKLIASCPLVVTENGMSHTKSVTIGVLNVESKEAGAEELINNISKRKDIYIKIAELGNLYISLRV